MKWSKILVLIVGCFLGLSGFAQAAITIEPITAYNFVVDSNVLSPSTYAPRAATIGAKFCNDGAVDITDVSLYTGDFSGTPAPGLYPQRDSSIAPFTTDHAHLANTGMYALTHEGGSAGLGDASRYIGTLPAGQCSTQYWLISYPNTNPAGTVSVTGGSIKPDDDLWLEYDFWATSNAGNEGDVTRRATMRNEISAAANKIWPNGDNKVPPEYKAAIADVLGWETLTPGGGSDAYPGETMTTQGVWYDLGNVGAGFDNDGDLVPDKNAWMQPVGDPSSFDSGCFRLVRTYGLVIVKLKGGGEKLIPFENQLYFQNIPENTGAVGLVYYEYVSLDGACTAGLSPYQEVASGFDNEKFSGDYGFSIPPLQSKQSLVTITKNVDQSSMAAPPGGTLTYTVDFNNTGTADAGNPAIGAPLVVQEAIPAGTDYVAGSTTSTLSASVLFSTDNGVSWVSTEPAPASVTNIQWWLDAPLAPAASGTVTFQVDVPGTYAGGLVANTAGLSFGSAPSFAEDSAITRITGTNTIGDTVFADDGAGGGISGNGIQDGGELGISLVKVSLYYDLNGDGQLDSGDVLIAEQDTDGSGNYSFGSLANGDYIAIVDRLDPDLAAGAGLTTPGEYSITLAGGDFLAADFGFSVALSVVKTLTSVDPAYTGDTVTYDIDVTNLLPPATTCTGSITTWAGSVTDPSSGGWITPANVQGAPDLLYASNDFDTGASWKPLLAETWNTGALTSGVTSVEILIEGNVIGLPLTHMFEYELYVGGVQVGTTQTYANLPSGPVSFVWDVTALRAWTIADFATATIELDTTKSGGAIATMEVDAVAFRIAADAACGLTTIPLTDDYDSTKLQFVSATIAPDTVMPGLLTWNNIAPIDPGTTKTISVTFTALSPGITEVVTTNTASVTNALFFDGTRANDDSDSADVTIRPVGSIGDTIFWDANGNGQQDANEAGVPGVDVTLTFPDTSTLTVTTDANGKYLFSNLTPSLVPDDYIVTVDLLGPLNGLALMADPNADGVPCTDPSVIAVCDNIYATTITAGANVMGADFGYQPPGVIGDTLWIDANNNGMRDDGEYGIAFVTVTIVELALTTETDSDGYYSFSNLPDGNYTVLVDTGDVDFPPLLTVSYDRDGTPDNVTVVPITSPAANIVLDADFGYRYVGTNNLSGTICLDDATFNGVCGIGASGVDTTETALSGTTAYLYLWTDAGVVGVVESGETTPISSILTDALGDYSFTNIPDGAFVVAVGAPLEDTELTTSLGDTPAIILVKNPPAGENISAYQGTASISASTNITGVDFAYRLIFNYDFGDLPNLYITTLTGGPRHVQAAAALYLGSTIDYDFNGMPTADATGDDVDSSDDEDGLTVLNLTTWTEGNAPVNGGEVDVDVTGTGYLIGWIDFNGDGFLTGPSEMIVNQSVVTGTYNIPFDIPVDGLKQNLFARFRLFPAAPPIPSLAYRGTTDNGEVEDYLIVVVGSIGDYIWNDANGDGIQDGAEVGIDGVTVDLYDDANGNGVIDGGELVVATATTAGGGLYDFTGLVAGDYIVDVTDTGSVLTGYTLTGGTEPHVVTGLVNGQDYNGADFGYQSAIDLSLVKTVSAGPHSVGDTVTFTLTVSNAGPSDATGISVVDVVPAGYSNITNISGTGGLVVDTITWSGLSIASGAFVTLSFDADIDASGSYINTAQVTAADQGDSDSTPNNNVPAEDDQDTATVTPAAVIDLSLVKTVSAGPYSVGDTVTFTLTVSNAGPSDATGVSVVDVVPAGYSNITNISGTGGLVIDTITWSGLSIASGAFVTLSFDADIDASGSYINTAQVTAADQGDSDSTPNNNVPAEDDQDTASVAPAAVIDLSLVKTVSAGPYSVGDTVTFTLTVSNAGPSDATGVSVVDVVPAGYSNITNISGTGGLVIDTITWNGLSIASGAFVTLSFDADIDASGSYINTAQVTAADQTDSDSTPNNNVPAEDDQDTATVAPAAVIDLSLVKTVSAGPHSVGDTVTFTLTVSNAGPSDATGVSVVDVVPAGYSNITNISGTGGLVVDTITWGGLSIASGAFVTLSFDADIDASGSYINTAQVTAADQTDSDSTPNNNVPAEDDQDTATVAPAAVIDLSLVKTVSAGPHSVGDTVTFTLTVSNAGPSDATGVSVVDVVPAGYSNITNISGTGGLVVDTITWGGLSIASGAFVTLSFDADIDASGSYINTAQVTAADQGDSDSTPNNNVPAEDDQDTATVTPAAVIDLSLVKTVSAGPHSVGDTVTFTLTVSNAGPSDATGISVVDVVPAGYSNITNISGTGGLVVDTITWSGLSITSGAFVTLSFDADIDASGSYINTAQVTAADQTDSDSTPNNNVPAEDDQDTATVAPAAVIDLSLVKTVSAGPHSVGDTVTFTLTVSNAGPSDATGISVVDVVPAGYSNITNISGTGGLVVDTITWSGLSITSGAFVTLSFDADIDASGSYINTAQVTAADQTDSDSTPNNNVPAEDDQDTATVTPAAVIDLSLVKSVSAGPHSVGDTVTFTLTVSNAGPSDATGVSVVDVVPAGYSNITNISGTGGLVVDTITWSGLSIASGAFVTLSFDADIDASGSYINTAQVTAADQGDSDSTPNNNVPAEDDQDTATVTPAAVIDLSLVKTVSAGPHSVGDTVTFTLTVSNAGPSDATGISVVDVVPAGYSNITNISGTGGLVVDTITWSGLSITSGAFVTLSFDADIDASGSYINTAQVTAADQTDSDSTPNNNVPAEDDQDTATVAPAAVIDLSLVKTVSAGPHSVGDTVTFTLTVSNAGPSDATGISVVDVVPAGYSNITNISGTGGLVVDTITWSGLSITSGAFVTLSFDADIDASGSYINTAQVTAADQTDSDSTPNNNVPAEDDQDTATVTPAAVIDLSLVKSVSAGPHSVGDTVTFTLTVSNAGPSDATGVSVVDVVPAGYSNITNISGTGGLVVDTITWSGLSITSGAFVTLSFDADIDASGSYINTAQVTAADQTDSDSTPNNNVPAEDDQDTATVAPAAVIDLSLVKTVSAGPHSVGDTVTFTLTVSNAGPSDATGISVVDVVPAGYSNITNISGTGGLVIDTITWSGLSIASGAFVTLSFDADIDASGSYINTAQVTAADQGDSDSTPNNNVPAEDDQDTATVTPAAVIDLSLVKTVSAGPYSVGDTVTFTLTVSNAGPSDATGVSVVDVVPAGYSNITNISGTGGLVIDTITWNGLSIASGAFVTLSFDADIDASGSYINTAQVTAADQTDSDSTPNNNVPAEDDQDTATVTPAAVIDLSLVKTVSAGPHSVGDTVTFTLTVANAGPSDATGVSVVDVVPAGYSNITNISGTGGLVVDTITWSGLSIASGAFVTLSFDADIDASGSYINTAQVTAADQTDSDSTPNNNVPAEDDQDTATVAPAAVIDLSLVKTVSAGPHSVGDTVTFTLTVSNAGPSDATGISVVDVVPAGYSNITNISGTGGLVIDTITWSGLSIASGAFVTLSFDADIDASGSYINTAQVTAADQGDSDSTPNNNVPAEDDQDTATVAPAAVIDLSLVKTVSAGPHSVGDTVTFTLTVANAGPSDATGVSVVDVVPAGYSNITNISGTGGLVVDTITWSGLSIASGAFVTLSFDADIDASGSYINTAQVTAADQGDSDSTPNNNVPAEDDQDTASVAPAAVIDLSLVKTVSAGPYSVGDTVTFTLTVANAGPSDATGVSVVDVVPAGYSNITNISGTGGLVVDTITWSGLSIASGAFVTLSFDADIDASGSYINTAQVTAADQTDSDSTPNNNVPAEDDQDTATVTPAAVIDLSLVKTVSAGPHSVGDTVTFTLTVANAGPSDATGISVVDVVPAGYSNITNISGTGGLVIDTITWNGLSIASGAFVTLSFDADIDASGSYINTAQVTAADQTDSDSTPNNNVPAEDDQDTATVTPAAVIDLSLVKTVSAGPYSVGDTVTFTLTVSNAGPSDATGISVVDVVPAGYSNITNISGTGGLVIDTITWSGLSIASGAFVTLSFDADIDASGSYINTAQVTAADQGDSDSTPNNNVPAEDDQDTATVTPAAVIDLSLVKTVSAGPYSVGDTVTFTLTVSNAGPSDATGVSVVDVVPAGYSNITNISGTGGLVIDTITWNGLSIASGAFVTLSFDADIDASGSYINTAQVTAADQTDSDSTPNNNVPAEDDQDTATVTPAAVIDLSLVKTVSAGPYSVGDTVTFTLTVSNAGPSDATGISVVDVVPAGYSNITNISGTGGLVVDTITWSGLSIASGAFVTLSFDADIDASGSYINTAQVTAADQTDSDSTPNNNVPAEDDQDTATVAPAAVIDLSLVKTVSAGPHSVGDTVTFTLTVSNAGPSDATGISVVDVVPAGYSNITNISGTGGLVVDTITWSGLSITSGAFVTLSFDADIDASGSYINTAQVTAADQTDSDSTPNNNVPAEDDQDTATVTPAAVIDLSLVKSVSAGPHSVGDTVTFTLTVSNAGPSDATGISVVDVVPAGYSNITNISGTGGLVVDTITWSGLSITSGAFVTLSFDADIDASGSYINTAQVTAADQTDSDSTPNNNVPAEDDQDTATVTPAAVIDLSLVKSVSAGPHSVGDTVTFTLTVSNAGPSDATGISVVDVVPAGYSNITNISGTGGLVVDTITWSGLSIASGAFVTLSFDADIDASGSYINTAQVTAADQGDSDSTPNNNVPAEDDQDTATVAPAAVIDLSLVKTVSAGPHSVGDTVTFTLTVANAGPSDATGISVVDVVPAGYSNITNISGTGGLVIDTITWSGLSIASGAFVTLTFDADIDASGSYINTAQVTAADQTDSDSTPNNNQAAEDDQDTATVAPAAVIDLSLVKTVSAGPHSVGDTVTFTLTVSNAGPSDATGVSVVDVVPAGYSNITNISGTGGLVVDTITWSGLSIASGAFVTLSFDADIDASGSYINTAQVTAADQTDSDSTPNNNVPAEDDQDTATVAPAALTLVKTITAGSPYAAVGDTVDYDYLVTNSGNIALAGPVTVADDKTLVTCPAVITVGNFDANLDPTEAITCTSTYTIVQADLDNGSVVNIATASADGTTSPDDTETATATTAPALTITKTQTSGQNPVKTIGVLGYEIVIENIGNISLTNIIVSDILPDGAAGIVTGPLSDIGIPGVLDVGESWTYTTSYTVTQADINAEVDLINIASVTCTEIPGPLTDDAVTPIKTFPWILFRSAFIPPICPDEPTYCYMVADRDNEGSDNSALLKYTFSSSKLELVGRLGVGNVETIALSLDGSTLYAVDENIFGVIDTTPGMMSSFHPINPAGVGKGYGAEGQVEFTDIDGMAFDPTTGILYATHRLYYSSDILLQINPSTGTFVRNAFGANTDYVVIGNNLQTIDWSDIDDITIDPAGKLYGTANFEGLGDRFVVIDKQTGVVNDLSTITINGVPLNDIEGLTYYNKDVFFGTTGIETTTQSEKYQNSFFRIDVNPVTAEKIISLERNFNGYVPYDYESVACGFCRVKK